MTEKDIAESITSERLVRGIELAEEIVFEEYDEVYQNWNDDPTNSDLSEVNELELALVSLRVVRELSEELSDSDEITNDMLQEIATSVPCGDASPEEIEAAVEAFDDVFEDDGSGLDSESWSPSV